MSLARSGPVAPMVAQYSRENFCAAFFQFLTSDSLIYQVRNDYATCYHSVNLELDEKDAWLCSKQDKAERHNPIIHGTCPARLCDGFTSHVSCGH
jgi:hypothetical protein